MSLINKITSIRTLLSEIPKRASSDFSHAQLLSLVVPLIHDDLYGVLAGLELTLEQACQRAGQQTAAELVRDIEAFKSIDGYWSEGPISLGVIDRAVRRGFLSIDEKAFLLRLIQVGRPPSEHVALSAIAELEEGVDHIERIFSRCGGVERTAQVSPTPSVSELSTRTVEFLSPIDDDRLRRELETKFKGRLEEEIPGTLGAIFVFKYPPNTYPERVAVKTVNPKRVKAEPGRTQQTEAINRLIYEVRQWIEYRHSPLILHPFFVDLVRGWPYIVMPYCERTLRDVIDEPAIRRGRSEAIALMVQCVAGLEFARQQGLSAHQDLKPENILLQKLRKSYPLSDDYPFNWRARLADFGLANAYRELGRPWGSRPYQAPEQYESTLSKADFSKVDVFACGVILHELLTGLHPIGLRTSEIWPEPKLGQSAQWKHESKWKRWAHSDRKLCEATEEGHLNGLRDLIEKTLRTKSEERPSLSELRCGLLDTLKETDHTAYRSVRILLEYFHFQSLRSASLDVDSDRYQLHCLKKLQRS